MSGLTIIDICEAMKTQLVNGLTRETNVYATPVTDPKAPSITIRLARPPDYWGTFGAGGLAIVPLELTIDPGAGDLQSMAMRLYDFLSVGTGNNSSVLDALLADTSLGLTGCTAMYPPDADGEVDWATVTATLPVNVHINKVGAEVG